MKKKEFLKIIEQATRENTTQLSLADRGFTSLPPEIGKFTNLTMFWLHNNQLTSLPAELGKLTNLTTLWLQNNQLTSIPAELRKLANLTQLYLADNKALTSPPPEVVQRGSPAILNYLRELVLLVLVFTYG